MEAQSIVGGENATTMRPEDIGIPSALTFQNFDTGFIKLMVLTVILMLTAVNAFAPKAAAGGHNFKMALFGAMTLCATGAVLLLVPPVAGNMFAETLRGQPTS